MRASPVLRTARSILFTQNVMGFCIYKGMLDPSKHIYMNHVPHNVYADYWPIGQYPEYNPIGSVAPATYQPRVQEILVQTLNSRYNLNLQEADVLDQRWDVLFRHVVKTEEAPQQFMDVLLRRLATGIFVRESKWTWVREQEIRLNIGPSLVLNETPETVAEFLQAYNFAIEYLVAYSNMGASIKIAQADSPQEKQYYNEMNDIVTGVAELKEQRPENNRFINRLLASLHSV